jgi:CBS-domain-containing membrane protein
MITDRDICIAVGTRGKLASEMSARDLLGRALRVCAPDEELVSALQSMEDGQVRRLPVVDGRGALVGVLSMNDLVVRAKNTPDGDISSSGLMKVLQTVSRHRSPGMIESSPANVSLVAA